VKRRAPSPGLAHRASEAELWLRDMDGRALRVVTAAQARELVDTGAARGAFEDRSAAEFPVHFACKTLRCCRRARRLIRAQLSILPPLAALDKKREWLPLSPVFQIRAPEVSLFPLVVPWAALIPYTPPPKWLV